MYKIIIVWLCLNKVHTCMKSTRYYGAPIYTYVKMHTKSFMWKIHAIYTHKSIMCNCVMGTMHAPHLCSIIHNNVNNNFVDKYFMTKAHEYNFIFYKY